MREQQKNLKNKISETIGDRNHTEDQPQDSLTGTNFSFLVIVIHVTIMVIKLPIVDHIKRKCSLGRKEEVKISGNNISQAPIILKL